MRRDSISRRSFIKGSIGVAAMIPLAGVLSACSSASSSSSGSASTQTSSSSQASTSSNTAQTEGAGAGKVLVAYYSAQGHTAAVADTIAGEINADTFAISPVQPYTTEDLNWQSDDSRVSREHSDESLRTVELEQVTPVNWDEYDTVFVGYPIWWAIAAWPMDGFVAGNDFSGKTVIPFCTSASSGLGESASSLESAAGTGVWQEGKRFQSSVSADEVAEWVAGLSI